MDTYVLTNSSYREDNYAIQAKTIEEALQMIKPEILRVTQERMNDSWESSKRYYERKGEEFDQKKVLLNTRKGFFHLSIYEEENEEGIPVIKKSIEFSFIDTDGNSHGSYGTYFITQLSNSNPIQRLG